MFEPEQIAALHDALTEAWHRPEARWPADPADALLLLITRQHRANFELWHIEDEARDPAADDTRIAVVKRRIDHTNQQRNDLVEQVDIRLLSWLNEQGLPNEAAPLNSETAGLMIDRLSILSLKIFHTLEQVERSDVNEEHRQRNIARKLVLEAQRHDLAGCLSQLWRETLAGTRRFKHYRQLKMYNDPSLNPAIYSRRR